MELKLELLSAQKPAGTSFDDLPEEWVCPMCYATKDLFDPLD